MMDLELTTLEKEALESIHKKKIERQRQKQIQNSLNYYYKNREARVEYAREQYVINCEQIKTNKIAYYKANKSRYQANYNFKKEFKRLGKIDL